MVSHPHYHQLSNPLTRLFFRLRVRRLLQPRPAPLLPRRQRPGDQRLGSGTSRYVYRGEEEVDDSARVGLWKQRDGTDSGEQRARFRDRACRHCRSHEGGRQEGRALTWFRGVDDLYRAGPGFSYECNAHRKGNEANSTTFHIRTGSGS